MSDVLQPRIDGAAPEPAPACDRTPKPAEGQSGPVSYQRLLAIGNLILFNDELDSGTLPEPRCSRCGSGVPTCAEVDIPHADACRGFQADMPLCWMCEREFLAEVLCDDLSVEVQLWRPTFDPLTAPCWWQWRPPCDCPDTSFGRNPHRWDCGQTPAFIDTIRAGYIPTMEFGS